MLITTIFSKMSLVYSKDTRGAVTAAATTAAATATSSTVIHCDVRFSEGRRLLGSSQATTTVAAGISSSSGNIYDTLCPIGFATRLVSDSIQLPDEMTHYAYVPAHHLSSYLSLFSCPRHSHNIYSSCPHT